MHDIVIIISKLVCVALAFAGAETEINALKSKVEASQTYLESGERSNDGDVHALLGQIQGWASARCANPENYTEQEVKESAEQFTEDLNELIS